MTPEIEQYLRKKYGEDITMKVVGNLVYIYTKTETYTEDINYLTYILTGIQ